MSTIWLLVFYHVLTTCTGFKTAEFIMYKRNTNTLTMLSTGPTFSAFSVISCATQCILYASPCYSFTFDPTSKLCAPGSRLIPPKSNLNSLSGEFYYTPGSMCDNSVDNFQLMSNGSVAACIWVPIKAANYSNARDFCRDHGAHLYTVKVPEKFYFLLNMSDANKVFGFSWVGLNDLVDEGVYRWEDDNSVININFTIFLDGEPNNYQDKEDCTVFNAGTNLMNDFSCLENFRFICETDPL